MMPKVCRICKNPGIDIWKIGLCINCYVIEKLRAKEELNRISLCLKK